MEAVLSGTPTDFARASSGPENPWACHCVTCSPRPIKTGFLLGQACLVWEVWPKGKRTRGTTEARLSIPGGRSSKETVPRALRL